jgi:hypothetical protein
MRSVRHYPTTLTDVQDCGENAIGLTRNRDLNNRGDRFYDSVCGSFETYGPRLVMAVVRRSLHRWWIPLITIAGSMLAPAGASAGDTGARCACAIGTCVGSWAEPSDISTTDNGCSAARRTDGAGSVGGSNMLPARSSRPRLDADEWDDRTDGDDDTDVPERTWLREMVRATDVIPTIDDARSDSIDTPSALPATYQRLRC